MVVVTQAKRPADFIISEANGNRSRDNIIIVSGAGVLKAGTVLGKITASGKWNASPATGATGVEAGRAVLLYPVDATSADVTVAALVRDCEVNVWQLVYESTVNDATKKNTKNAELASNSGIVVR